MAEAARNPPLRPSIAELVGSSRYNAIGDDTLKDEDNAAWVMFLPPDVARDWIEPFSWIRLIDRLAESEWIEGWGSRFQVFRIGWRTLLLTGYVLPDDYHHGLLSRMRARWFVAPAPAGRPHSRPPVRPGLGPVLSSSTPPPVAPSSASAGASAPPRSASISDSIIASVAAPSSTSSGHGSSSAAGPAWSVVHAWDEYVEATARYTRSDMVFETLAEYEHMLQSLGGSLFQIFPYLTEPQRQAVRAFGAVDQLFNHLRDLPEDTAQNLCYFPADVLDRFGVERQEILDGSCFQNPGYVKLMNFWISDFVPYLYSKAASFLSDNEMHYSWRLLKHWFLRRHVRLEQAFRRAGMNYKAASMLYFAEVKPGLSRWLRETFTAEGRLDLLAAGPRPLPALPSSNPPRRRVGLTPPALPQLGPERESALEPEPANDAAGGLPLSASGVAPAPSPAAKLASSPPHRYGEGAVVTSRIRELGDDPGAPLAGDLDDLDVADLDDELAGAGQALGVKAYHSGVLVLRRRDHGLAR